MAEKKSIGVPTAKAVAAVLEKQKGVKRWDAGAHIAGLAYLAADMPLVRAEPENPKSPLVFDRKGFMALINAEPAWLYCSNMKKLLVEVGEIPAQDAKTAIEEYN